MLNKISRGVILLAFAMLATGCATQSNYDYSAFRQSQPRSILVLPPLNQSPDVRAPYSMMATVTAPLAESGYYVFPVALVDQTFRENGMTNPGEIHDASPAKLAEVFGADAVLYITISEYGAKYFLIDSQVIVSASARLVDLRNGQLLWEGKASASNAEGRDNSGGGVAGILISALIRQVANNLGDQGYPVARMTSHRLLTARPGGLLPGPRSPEYQKVVGN
jgi:hypothetical protein